MSQEQFAYGAATILATLTGATALVRWAVTPVRPPGRHRASGTTVVPLEDLLGPPSAYTTPDFADAPVHGVLTQAWRPCTGLCGGEMPSVLHKDGWTCGHCLTVTKAAGGAR